LGTRGFGQKKWVRRRWGEDLIGGFSSPHTLLPKEEKEEKIAFCMFDVAKKVPLYVNDLCFHLKGSRNEKNSV
jgi:hypothetical protein